jgi:hypothetical protein
MTHRWSTLADDLPRLTAAQLATHPDALEWWYFDLTAPDGGSLVFVFARVNPLLNGAGRPSVSLEFQAGPDAPRRFAAREFAPGDFTSEPRPDGHELRLGPENSIRLRRGPAGGVAAYEVRFELGGWRGELIFEPRSRGFLPGGDGRYFDRPDDPAAGCWVNFAAPWQRARGRLTGEGRTHELAGEGYHDHPWTTESFFTTSAGWHWGRTYLTPAGCVLYADVHPLPPWRGALKFVYEASAAAPEELDWDPHVTYAEDVDPFPWLAWLWPPAVRRAGRPPQATGADEFRRNWLAMRQPGHTHLAVARTGLAVDNRFTGWILKAPVYCRSAAATLVTAPDRPGHGRGWVEYVAMPARGGRLLLRLLRLLLRLTVLR